MTLRIPPGRAGRIWLVRRLETARRGAELLDRKRQALLREQSRASSEAEVARRAWNEAATAVLACGERAIVLDGRARQQQLGQYVEHPASIALTWSNLMGAKLPRIEHVTLPERPPLSALGGGAATVLAADACRRAVEAAVRYAVAQRAEAELQIELARAAQRLRALQERWIPQHEQALMQLDLALDENQREQAARVRWLANRRESSR